MSARLRWAKSASPSAITPLAVLAQSRAERYFIGRTFQDAKSEGGWDELVARKYRARRHHTALDALVVKPLVDRSASTRRRLKTQAQILKEQKRKPPI